MKRSLKTLAVVAVAAFVALPAAADSYLGARIVADHSETDIINVGGNDRYQAVQFCVAQRAVHFRDIDVIFANGGHQDLPVRLLIGPGGCTRWIDLNGPRRNIEQVVLRYDTLVNAGAQAVVVALGR